MTGEAGSVSGVRLRITEIFRSLQGEADTVGFPTVFVRLTGCPLRCQYCDTAYAFHGGEWWTSTQSSRGSASSARATSASPAASRWRRRAAAAAGARCAMPATRVSLETSGAHRIAGVDPRVVRVVDVKTPGSGRGAPQPATRSSRRCATHDQVKFVICDRADYEWSRALLAERWRSPRAARCCSRRATTSCRRASSPTGSWPTACRCASRCSCTRSSGATCRANERVRRRACAASRRRAALRRPRFGHGAGARARARLRVPRAVGGTTASATRPSWTPRRAWPRRSARRARVMRVDLAASAARR